MKTLLCLVLLFAGFLALGAKLHSQAPTAPKSQVQILQAMKAKNQEIIQKQEQTLLQLDTLEKEAEQIKIFAKRS